MLFKHSSFQLVVNFFVALLRSIVSMNAHNLWDFTCLNAHPTPYLLRGQFFTRARQATYFKKKEIKTLTGSCIHYELIRSKNHQKIGSCFIARLVFPFCVVEKILWKLFANIFDIAKPQCLPRFSSTVYLNYGCQIRVFKMYDGVLCISTILYEKRKLLLLATLST